MVVPIDADVSMSGVATYDLDCRYIADGLANNKLRFDKVLCHHG